MQKGVQAPCTNSPCFQLDKLSHSTTLQGHHVHWPQTETVHFRLLWLPHSQCSSSTSLVTPTIEGCHQQTAKEASFFHSCSAFFGPFHVFSRKIVANSGSHLHQTQHHLFCCIIQTTVPRWCTKLFSLKNVKGITNSPKQPTCLPDTCNLPQDFPLHMSKPQTHHSTSQCNSWSLFVFSLHCHNCLLLPPFFTMDFCTIGAFFVFHFQQKPHNFQLWFH